MALVDALTSRTSRKISAQAEPAALLSSNPVLPGDAGPPVPRAIINPKRGMEYPQSPQPCNSLGAAGRSCGNLMDVRLMVLLVTLAGALILLLLYKLLQMRHRLRLAQARHALEYHSFYHSATYTLKHTMPEKNGTLPEDVPMPTVTPVPSSPPAPHSPPPLLLPPPPVLPPLPLQAPPLHRDTAPVPPVLSFPLPVIHTVPPSPHLSWGACSDADVYSRIGAFRPSRLSSLSSQSTVVLFEHSSL